MEPTPGDFLSLEDSFDESQKLIQKTARNFVIQEVLPNITANYEAGFFPKELIKKLGNAGFLGAHLTGFGCAGLDTISYGLVMQELERGDSGLRSFASVQGALVMEPIFTFGSEEQKQKWLPLLGSGNAVGCFGLTEPDFGSNPAGMQTSAKHVNGKWILNGSKTWITNAPIADVAVVWAKTDEGVRGFLVEKGMKGFSSQEIKLKLSLRASITGTLYFDNCELPETAVLPKSKGLKSALHCLNHARFGIAWGATGAAQDCLEEALNYAKNRIVFDKPLAATQLVQRKLALMSTQIALAKLTAFQLARLKDAKKLHPSQISMAKQNNVLIALECARMARDILGANGVSGEYHCMRHACNLESVYTYEGTNDIHLLIVGQQLTGLQAFS